VERDAHLQSLFYLSFRVPSKRALPPGSIHRVPIARDTPSRAPFNHLSKSLVDETPSKFPSRAPVERDAFLHSLFYLPFRVPSKGALLPGSPQTALIDRDAPPPETLSTSPR